MTAGATRSCLYEARVMHARRRPVAHRFEYPIFLWRFDLDELPALHRRLRLFSYNRPNLAALHDADYAGAAGVGVKASILAYLRREGVAAGDDWRIDLYTHVRLAGYVFNPVVFFVGTAPSGEVAAIVAEVRNTFGKVHRFLLDGRTAVPATRGRSYTVDKLLHVSPFFDLDMSWTFHFRSLEDRLDIAMDATPHGQPDIFHARLWGEARPLTDGEILRLSARYPLVTVQVFAGIHWQALKLWLKGAPFHAEPPYDPDLVRRRHDRPDPLARAARASLAVDDQGGPPPGARRPVAAP